jgi:hypothetical protein
VNIDDSEVSLHGPFDFATMNNRKTQDRISEKDWLVLGEREALYHNRAPKVTTRAMHIDITQPIYKKVWRPRRRGAMPHLHAQHGIQ